MGFAPYNALTLSRVVRSHFRYAWQARRLCGRAKMKPFVLSAFCSKFYSHFWPNWRPIYVMRPLVVFLYLPLFVGASAAFGPWSPNPPFVRFDPQNGRFEPSKTLSFKEKCPLLSGTGDSQRDSRESIRANHSQSKPLFL